MVKKLPGHLASLLRHQPKEQEAANASNDAPIASQDTAGVTSRKARRRAVARQKQKDMRAKQRAQLEADCEAAKAKAKAAAASAAEIEANAQEATEKSAVKRKVLKAKQKPKAARPSRAGSAASAAWAIFDPEGAERDERLMRSLGPKLGISGGPEERQRAEQKIFAELGFDDDLLADLEPPSSDEEFGGDETASGSTRPRVRTGNRHLSELLQGILDASAPAHCPRRTGLKRRKAQQSGAEKRRKQG
mmetsp:Transcript_113933/g.317251  ORF Transcript_113933/g.317251 Transcript_113933/m.317251 type:complete len:248 (-) Transcript_113933:173-916(-)